MKEIWKWVKGYEGIYSVSNLGNVISLSREFTMKNGRKHIVKNKKKKSQKNYRGYERTQLTDADGNKEIVSVHRLVMFTFKPEGYFNGAEVNHKNGIKDDNRLENLEWCTKEQNETHAKETGLKLRGNKHKISILTELSVRVIREAIHNGHRGVDIARYFNVSSATISSIKVNRNWGWL